VLALFWLTAKVLMLLAGLIVPGAALMRAFRVPATLATSFAGSAVALYATVLTLQVASIRISLGTMASGLAIVAVTALLIARVSGRQSTDPVSQTSLLSRAGLREGGAGVGAGWLFAAYAIFWIAVLWRACREPLAGPDIEFRWSFLAEQMLRTGSLDFYPPQSWRDFLSYFWVESVPPGASSLHGWAYACGGNTELEWTIAAVLLQLVTVHEMMWRTATNVGGDRAGYYTCLALAACPLLTWSLLLGQETGLTTLAAAGIIYALTEFRRTSRAGWAAAAGIFAVLGASSREYGLIFPALGAAGLIVVGANRRACLLFLGVTSLALVWPVRTWLLTGNPFYSLALGGLPVNPRFIAWIEHDAAALGAPLHTANGWFDIARYLILFAPAAVVGWTALTAHATRRNRDALAVLFMIGSVIALWLISVRYTNGGLFYSMRVLSPAFALGALGAGIAAARWRGRSDLVLSLLLLFTLPATLALPQNPMRTPWREWPAFQRRGESRGLDETVAFVLRLGNRGTILADSPGFQRRFLPHGVPVIPLWSPGADWLFDATLSAAETVRRWRESGVRHILIAKWQTNLDFFQKHARWNVPPIQVQLIGETNEALVFAVTARE
jgi:hypothetical protein